MNNISGVIYAFCAASGITTAACLANDLIDLKHVNIIYISGIISNFIICLLCIRYDSSFTKKDFHHILYISILGYFGFNIGVSLLTIIVFIAYILVQILGKIWTKLNILSDKSYNSLQRMISRQDVLKDRRIYEEEAKT